MSNAWMIRASGGDSMELFESGIVAIGFGTSVDLSKLDRDGIAEAYSKAHAEASKNKAGGVEELLASLFRAMGFKATVSPVGPDRGIDVIASPDGLGLQDPRIKAEVKHRKDTRMGPQDVRNFIGALRPSDRGVYLSTGGFTKEARYEAERANVPVTLLDLDGLARLIESHYDNFDTDGRTLLPLTRVLWPAD